MPIDEYKTQVLLLHSEQTALDTLSAGFGERYTVHCATSGSEALNTMIDTPINVIITAQDLPGMSGVEALKEAKKRSPDTIGILLAGSGNEAIVGEEEVFQVVHGDVTSDGLKQLVDNATRQLRLMALADSANDTTANPDLTAEHIVMETSENGSTIISDGTGRLPILDPKKVSAAQSVGAKAVDILVLTKDQEFLETIRDSSRGMHEVHYANTLSEADQAIRKHKVGVAVVDAAMVGEKVEQLTQHLRKNSPRLVSIVAGRRDDGEMLMDLINRGKVYRFLLKPVSPGRARLAVEASVKHHLEAPDAAFKANGKTASAKPVAARPAPKPAEVPKAKPKPEQKAAPKAKPVSKPAPKPVQKAAPKPAPKAKPKPEAPKAPKTVDPPLGSVEAPQGGSPIEDGLADAFSSEDSRFTETVTGLVSSFVGKSSDTPAEEVSIDDLSVDGLGSAPESSGGSGGSMVQPKFIGVAAAAVVVIAGALFWFMNGSDRPATEPEQAQTTESVTESNLVIDEVPLGGSSGSVDVDAMLDDARAARDAGQIFNPVGSNAIELYAAALAADPQNSVVAAELDATVSQAVGMAETAILEGRVEDADAALSRVAAADSDNARLPFLTAQLTQMQLRTRLDDARTAIREDRFEDAASAIAAARNLNVADTGEIESVDAELSEARSAQAVDEVLAKANARLESGDLLSPANDNARYYYQLVLSNDPGNVSAVQGLNVVASRLVLQARGEIDAGNLNAAERLLEDARAIDSSNSELTAAFAAIQSERDAVAARWAAAAKREREAELERQRQAELERQRLEDEARAEQERLAAEQSTDQTAEPAGDVASEESTTSDAGDTVANADGGVAAGEPTAQDAAPATTPAAKQTPAAVSSLNRVKYVAPKYPRSARRRNLSGWVDVVFTVGYDGSVKDIEIRNSEPGDIFVNAARTAVEKWEFEPVVENGRLVEKRAGVRMMFALE